MSAYSFPTQLKEKALRESQLISTPMGIKKGDKLTEAKGWKELVAGLPEERAIFCASMCENYKNFINAQRSIDETTTALQVGNFEKFGFPIISMTAENLIAPEIVNVQALQGPSSTIFYMDYVTSRARGGVPKGTSVWDARKGHFILGEHGSENVPNETMFTEVTATTAYSGNLSQGPIRPGSLAITRGAATLIDDGNGVITGSGLTGTNIIDYVTGAFTVTVTTEVNAQVVTASYVAQVEGTERMGLDFQITSSLVHARELSLSGRWTIEAAHALNALHGQNAEAQLTAAISSELTFEIDRIILSDLRRIAGAGSVVWDATPPTSVSFTEHKLTIMDTISEGSQFVHRATNRVRPNWIVGGLQFCTIVENLPMFVAENAMQAEADGIIKLGKLGRYVVFCDPHADIDSFIMGYKGNDWMRTGYVYAPWLLLYTTPTTILDDMVARKGFLTMFGNKVVNDKYYVKGTITNFTAAF